MTNAASDGGPRFYGVRLVVFDLDGTLVDAFGDIAAAANVLLARLKRPPMTVDEVKRHVGRGVYELVAGVLGTREEKMMALGVEVFTDYYTRNATTHARVYDGVREALVELRRHGIRTAVASNKPHALTRRVVDQVGLGELFDDVFGQSDLFPRKPAPDLLQHLMNAAGTTARTTILVGDSPTDVEFANAAGVACVVVSQGQATREELEEARPAAILDSMHELPALIL